MTGVAIGHYEAKQILCNALTYNNDLSFICLPFVLQLRVIVILKMPWDEEAEENCSRQKE